MHRLMDKGLEQLTAMVFKMGEAAEKALSDLYWWFRQGKRYVGRCA